MKTHGPKTPRSIRGLRNRRNLIGAIDAKSTQDADLSEGEIVNSFGTQFFNVTVPGNSTPFIVANQTGGRSFAPGSKVILASFRGKPGQAVIGGAPAGKKGGTSTTRSTRRRGTSATAAAANQYAFGYDGLGNSVASLYFDGTFISARATIAGEDTFTGIILSDESLLVGDGSVLMRTGDTLKVWDVEGAAVHSYSVPGGWVGATQLYYQNGFLYWCEMEDVSGATTFDVRLRKADTDLGNVSTLSTYTSPDAVTDYGVPWTQWQIQAVAIAFAVDADAAILYVESKVWDEADASDWHGLQIRFLLSGANAFREFDTPELGADGTNTVNPGGVDFPCATASMAFVIAEPIDGVQSVLSKNDDASTAATGLWNPSDLDGIPVSAFNVGTGGSILQVHSYSAGKILRGGGSGTIVTSAIDAFDATPNYPAAMFYSGA